MMHSQGQLGSLGMAVH